jgi:hypothetical protein
MNIIISDQMDPYSKVINHFVLTQFPQKLCVNNPDLIDLLTDEVLGTKQTRYGPKPSPESIVAIRDIIRHYVSQRLPIPFMVPWGSEKPNGSGIDVAELSALKTIHALQNRISSHYQAGAVFNIRLEDASAPHLFDDKDEARKNAKLYTDAFVKLVYVLGIDGFVKAIPESTLTTEETFNAEADSIVPYMEQALKALQFGNEAEGKALLQSLGWSGSITQEMRDYYYGQYAKLYPHHSIEGHIKILARYFAGSLARYRLKIRGDAPEWQGKFLDLSFPAPIPGTAQLFNRRIYYRTVPSEFTSNHMPAWRAKGYLTINNDNEATPKLGSFFEQRTYNTHCMKLRRDNVEVKVQADYILA